MVEVKRKKGETFDALLRRFQRRFQDSGRNIEKRRRKFRQSIKNKNERRKSAVRREKKRVSFVYLLKTGQLKENMFKKRPQR